MSEKIIKYIKSQWLIIAGGFAGALGGYLYWYFIGCNSGTCPITSSPLNSTLYGILLGGLIFSMFKNKPKKEKETEYGNNKQDTNLQREQHNKVK